MRFLPGSRSPQIIEMHKRGMRASEIARDVGCTRSNVTQVLKRCGLIDQRPKRPKLTMRIAHLADDDRKWLKREARRMRVRWQDLARAMLSDAISEVRDGKG